MLLHCIFFFFFFFFFFCLFRTALEAYRNSQARGSNRSCSCWPIPQPQQCSIWATSEMYTTAHNTGSPTEWGQGLNPHPRGYSLDFFLLHHNVNSLLWCISITRTITSVQFHWLNKLMLTYSLEFSKREVGMPASYSLLSLLRTE